MWKLFILFLSVVGLICAQTLPNGSQIPTPITQDITLEEGGTYFISSVVNVVADNIKITGKSTNIFCASTNGIIVNGRENFTANGVIMHNCIQAFQLVSADRYIISNSKLINNSIGILLSAGSLSVSHCFFIDNGNGINNIAASILSISHSEFHFNKYGIDTRSSTIVGDNVEFENNICAIKLVDASEMKISNSTFFNNTGENELGIIRSLFSKFNITNSDISSNNGFTITAVATEAIITNSSINNNTPGTSYFNRSSSVIMNTTTIQGNNAIANSYGAVRIESSSFSATNLDCFSNIAQHSGCIFSSNGSSIFLYDSVFLQNEANSGGGIYSISSSIFLSSTRFTANYANDKAGAIALVDSISDIYSCSFFFNTATNGAGALLVEQGSDIKLRGSDFSDNNALLGGAIAIQDSVILIINNKISINRGSGSALHGRLSTIILNNNEIIESSKIGILVYESILVLNSNTGNYSMIVRAATVSASLGLPHLFCCSGIRQPNPISSVCNYPSCTIGCEERVNSCDCPFNFARGNLFNTTCTCKIGYSGEFCQDRIEDPCSLRNGGCDPRKKCNFVNGYVECGPCPNGTIPVGPICKSRCGDLECQEEYGETCVSCPQDCGSSGDCGICGDSVCSNGETCKTCFQDCGFCDTPSCKCSKNGKCQNGVCVCDALWTGPTCDSPQSQPINVTVNTTSPDISIGTPISGDSPNFIISIKELSELDSNGNIVRSFSLSDVLFYMNQTEIEGNTKFNYTGIMPNDAVLSIIIWQFERATTVEFASTTTSFQPHTLKLNFRIQNWPFFSLGNTLAIVMNNDVAGEIESCISEQKDEQGNLRWLMVNVNDYSLYGQFLDKAIVDGRIRVIPYTLNNDNTVLAVLPHFWDFAEMDPNYNILLGEENRGEECSRKKDKKRVNKKLILSIVIPVVGVAILVGIAIVSYPRIKLWVQLRKQAKLEKNNKLKKQTTKKPSIEKLDKMETTTSAGTFTIQL